VVHVQACKDGEDGEEEGDLKAWRGGHESSRNETGEAEKSVMQGGAGQGPKCRGMHATLLELMCLALGTAELTQLAFPHVLTSPIVSESVSFSASNDTCKLLGLT
jgi:hypothetical protein